VVTTGNANISTTNLNFLTWGTNSHTWKSVHDIMLQPGNTVYVLCKTIQFIAVNYGWAEAIFTQQNKVKGIFSPSHRKSMMGSYKKCHSWTHFHHSRKPKCVLKPCCEKVTNKTNIQSWLIPTNYVTSWSTHKFPVGSVKQIQQEKFCQSTATQKSASNTLKYKYVDYTVYDGGTKILKADTADNQKSPILKLY
jgi:hypothetical protein